MDELTEEESLLEEPAESAKAEEGLDWPETPPTAPTHNYQVANKKYTDNKDTEVKAGAEAYTDSKQLAVSSDNLKLSNDTERSHYAPWDIYQLVTGEEITSTVSGKIKTKFDFKKANVNDYPVYAKIYVNNVAVGSAHTKNDTAYATFTDTGIDVEVGDVVQIYVTGDSANSQSNTIYVKNFRLYWDISTKGYIDAGDNAIVASMDIPDTGIGDVMVITSDTERNTSQTTYTKLKEIRIDEAGNYRIKFDIKSSELSYNCFGRIYKNGVAIGLDTQSNDTTTYATKEEDFTGFVEGDLIQLYVKAYTGKIAYIRNFRFYINRIAYYGTILTD